MSSFDTTRRFLAIGWNLVHQLRDGRYGLITAIRVRLRPIARFRRAVKGLLFAAVVGVVAFQSQGVVVVVSVPAEHSLQLKFWFLYFLGEESFVYCVCVFSVWIVAVAEYFERIL